jgi:Flp pilus assembly protein TadG
MSFAGTILGFRSRLRRFARDSKALAAIEFAFVLPIMLLLYIGGVEVGNGMALQFKVTLAARTVADLSSQYTSISTAQMSSILDAAPIVMSPYSATGITVTVSEVTTDANSKATITWSCSINGSAHAVGQTVTLPSGVQMPSISVIWGEVTYPYQPSMGYVLTGTINLYQSIYFYPRMTTSVPGPAPSACPTS